MLVSLVVGQRNLSKIPPSPTGPERKGSDYYRIIPLLVVFSPLPFVFLFWVIFVVVVAVFFFSLEFVILLTQTPRCYDGMQGPSCMVSQIILFWETHYVVLNSLSSSV